MNSVTKKSKNVLTLFFNINFKYLPAFLILSFDYNYLLTRFNLNPATTLKVKNLSILTALKRRWHEKLK